MSIILPKTYEATKDKYKQHNGKPKLSYSQYNSWISPEYRKDYILRYFMGRKDEGNKWSDFGGEIGKFIESHASGSVLDTKIISNEDIEILKGLEYTDNCEYEDEIVVDMGDFVIQGFIDRSKYKDNEVIITDFKTGNIDKADLYRSEDYGQTTLYSFQKEVEGFKIAGSNVLLLGRKGNGYAKSPIRLSGETLEIETPYSKKRAILLLEKMKKAAIEISNAYNVYKKLESI